MEKKSFKDRVAAIASTPIEPIKEAKGAMDKVIQKRLDRLYRRYQNGEVSEARWNAALAAASAIGAVADYAAPDTVGEAAITAGTLGTGAALSKGAKLRKALKTAPVVEDTVAKERKLNRLFDAIEKDAAVERGIAGTRIRGSTNPVRDAVRTNKKALEADAEVVKKATKKARKAEGRRVERLKKAREDKNRQKELEIKDLERKLKKWDDGSLEDLAG